MDPRGPRARQRPRRRARRSRRPGEGFDQGRRQARPSGRRGPKTYILLNKPKGFVTTVSDPEGRDTVLDLLPGKLRRGVKPVGRLDVQTEGLLLLTDDGDLARLVTHPSTGCAKEYLVKVSGEPRRVEAREAAPRAISARRRARRGPASIERVSGTPRKGEDGGQHLAPRDAARGPHPADPADVRDDRPPVSKLKRVAIGPIRDARPAARAPTAGSPTPRSRPRRVSETKRVEPDRSSSPSTGPPGPGSRRWPAPSPRASAFPTSTRAPCTAPSASRPRAAGCRCRSTDPEPGRRDRRGVRASSSSRRRRAAASSSTARTSPRRSGEPEISLYASAVSAIPAVRRLLVAAAAAAGPGAGGRHGRPGHRDQGLSRDPPQVLPDGRPGRSGPSGGPGSSPSGAPRSPTRTCSGRWKSATGTTLPGPIRP